MTSPVIKGNSYILIHTPDCLINHGSTQLNERQQNPDSRYLQKLPDFLRNYEDCTAYAPNQTYIGNIEIDELKDIKTPWYKNKLSEVKRFSKWGEIMPEEEFYGLMKIVDSFDLVFLSEKFAEDIKIKLEKHPLINEEMLNKIKGVENVKIQEMIEKEVAQPMYMGNKLAGCIKQAHDTDPNLTGHIMLENIICKASGVLALLHLGKQEGIDLSKVDYVIEVSEEACGDINQRGGGNFAKSIAEIAGCSSASGSDIRSFCAAPAHGIINAAGLVASGIYDNVAVVAGGSTAKLGMNAKDHVKAEMPVLEDCLGGFAILISKDDGQSPLIRTDAIGRHKVGTGSSPQAVITSLVTEPLEKIGLKIQDIDKYSVEMQNPEITKPAGAGNVPESNYKMIAALGVKRGELERSELMNFVAQHGMPGFAPTQGHIPSGIPFIGHALRMMKKDRLKRAMIIGKGSLFLGRMTNLFDGISFIIEKNEGKTKEKDISEEQIKEIVADAMRNLADNLLKYE